MILFGKEAQRYLEIQARIREAYEASRYKFYKPFTMTNEEAEKALYTNHGQENEGKFVYTNGGQFLAYDHTPQLAMFAAQNREFFNEQARLYTIGPVFRQEENDKTHWVEFTQCDADIVFADDQVFDTADSLILAHMVLEILGISYYVRIFTKDDDLDQLAEINRLTCELDIELIIDPSLRRGAEYYTGPVFEGFAKNGDGKTALFGGGYYPLYYKGEYICDACGFAFSVERLMFNASS